MYTTKEQLAKFKEIYKKRFGRNLDDQSAQELALKLLTLTRIIYRPINKSDLDRAKRRRNELDAKT